MCWLVRFFILALAGAVTTTILGRNIDPCGMTCIRGVMDIALTGLGCDPEDLQCVCSKEEFGYGLKDCATESCPSAIAQQVVEDLAVYVASYCAGSSSAPVIGAPDPTNTPLPPEGPQPGTALTGQGASSSTAKTASSRGSMSSTSSSKELSDSLSIIPATSSSFSDPSEAPFASVEPSAEQSTPEAEARPLSLASKVGIGIGICTAVVIIIAIAFLVFSRRHSRKRDDHVLQISNPLPGSGRDFSGAVGTLSDKPVSELETKSKRYEDLAPTSTLPKYM